MNASPEQNRASSQRESLPRRAELRRVSARVSSRLRFRKDQKTLEFTDEIFDKSRNERVTRKLTITASDKYGLPTAMDDEVILGLIQLTGKSRLCRSTGVLHPLRTAETPQLDRRHAKLQSPRAEPESLARRHALLRQILVVEGGAELGKRGFSHPRPRHDSRQGAPAPGRGEEPTSRGKARSSGTRSSSTASRPAT